MRMILLETGEDIGNAKALTEPWFANAKPTKAADNGALTVLWKNKPLVIPDNTKRVLMSEKGPIAIVRERVHSVDLVGKKTKKKSKKAAK